MSTPPFVEGRTAILHLRQPAFPQFAFEWHPQLGNVYLIHKDQKTAHAIGHDIRNEGLARQIVFVFLRGYRQALVDVAPTPWEPPKSPIPPVQAESSA